MRALTLVHRLPGKFTRLCRVGYLRNDASQHSFAVAITVAAPVLHIQTTAEEKPLARYTLAGDTAKNATIDLLRCLETARDGKMAKRKKVS